jgi:hypothetical protein
MSPRTPKSVISQLHKLCGETLDVSLSGDAEERIKLAYSLVSEFDAWNSVLADRVETQLYGAAQREYLMSVLALCQGQYRNAFKSMRLTLELYLQGVALSTDEIALHEWLSNERNTNWSSIVHNELGVFSPRYCKVYFPELTERAPHYEAMARTLYRELSECTHGNFAGKIILADTLAFDQAALDAWATAADTLRLLTHFALTLRYLKKLETGAREKLQPMIMDQLGHISPIRVLLGGPSE